MDYMIACMKMVGEVQQTWRVRLSAPIILVLNAARMSRSAAAMVSGYQNFEPDTWIAGVILNHIAHGRHEAKLRQAIETYCGIPVLGTFPRDEKVLIPDRHLGLIPRGENNQLVTAIDACRSAAEDFVDLHALMKIARSAPPVEAGFAESPDIQQPVLSPQPRVRIGVIRDRAFTFYYPENLEALARAGAELMFVDAFTDVSLPDVHALVIGGGFPELFMDELAANQSFMKSIYNAVQTGLPVYAECGGLMYLSRGISWRGNRKKFVNVLPYDVIMEDYPQGHGYVTAKVTGENPFFPLGTVLRGHEFHHSKVVNLETSLPTVYQLERGNGIFPKRDAFVYKNVLAAYTHLHADGAPAWASGLVRQAKEYASERAYG